MLLSEYDIQYVTQKAIKGSVLVEYLAHQPVEDYQPLKFDFPDEDIMVIKDCEIPGPDEGPEPGPRWNLAFDEYEACILGIEAAIDLQIEILEVYGDSALVIYQVKDEWETRDAKLIPYRAHVVKMIEYFDDITFHHIPRVENQVADALATLASMYQVRFHNEAPLIRIERRDEPAYCQLIEEETDGRPWFHDIKRYLLSQEYPEDAKLLDKKTLRRLSSKFFLSSVSVSLASTGFHDPSPGNFSLLHVETIASLSRAPKPASEREVLNQQAYMSGSSKKIMTF
ncbi:uncharacterized protein LOC127096473 [Lathyrus oleraceus]|uniref:uncharacterized protein LOC127096473 n=1 Tax=Pisum sativum TaxID=3888 RepID=UPI0021D19ACB|nr:uncharacterized protein LOC127096473 [Pisum sativum]